MTASAKITLLWGDGDRAFRLAIGQLRELQDKCDAGPAEILGRLSNGTWRVDDIRETLRLGLIGGGATPTDALVLTARYVDNRPLMENVMPAQAVLLAAIVGEEEPPGKTGSEKTMSEVMDASSSRQSSALEQS